MGTYKIFNIQCWIVRCCGMRMNGCAALNSLWLYLASGSTDPELCCDVNNKKKKKTKFN